MLQFGGGGHKQQYTIYVSSGEYFPVKRTVEEMPAHQFDCGRVL